MQVEHIGAHPRFFGDIVLFREVLYHLLSRIKQRIDLRDHIGLCHHIDHATKILMHDHRARVDLTDIDHLIERYHHPLHIHKIKRREFAHQSIVAPGVEGSALLVKYQKDRHLVGEIFGVLVCDLHPFKSEIKDIVNLLDRESASGDLLFVRNKLILFVDLICHHINIDEPFGFVEDICYLIGKFAILLEIVTMHLNDDRCQCWRPCRLLNKFDIGTRYDRQTFLFGDRAKPLYHQERRLLSLMLVCQVDRDLCNILCLLHTCTLDKSRIVQRNTLSKEELDIHDLLLFFEHIDHTLADSIGLLDR